MDLAGINFSDFEITSIIRKSSNEFEVIFSEKWTIP